MTRSLALGAYQSVMIFRHIMAVLDHLIDGSLLHRSPLLHMSLLKFESYGNIKSERLTIDTVLCDAEHIGWSFHAVTLHRAVILNQSLYFNI